MQSDRLAMIEALGYKREVVTAVRWQNEVRKANGQSFGFILSENFLETATDAEFHQIVNDFEEQSKVLRKSDGDYDYEEFLALSIKQVSGLHTEDR